MFWKHCPRDCLPMRQLWFAQEGNYISWKCLWQKWAANQLMAAKPKGHNLLNQKSGGIWSFSWGSVMSSRTPALPWKWHLQLFRLLILFLLLQGHRMATAALVILASHQLSKVEWRWAGTWKPYSSEVLSFSLRWRLFQPTFSYTLGVRADSHVHL